MTRSLIYLVLALVRLCLTLAARFVPISALLAYLALEPIYCWAKPRPPAEVACVDLRLAYPASRS